MEFFSLRFVLFVVISLVTYYLFYKFAPKKQWIVLLVANMIFYSWKGLSNFFFIFVTTFSVYVGALLLARISAKIEILKKELSGDKDRLKKEKQQVLYQKRMILFFVLIINFGILSYIKYWHTFYNGISSLFRFDSAKIPFYSASQLILPLGISFFIFQAVAYLVDVYNNKYEAQRNFFKFLLFISYFPQLIQGPINRYDKISVDLYRPQSFDWQKMKPALFLILFGLLKKYAIANLLVDSVGNILDSPLRDLSGSVIAYGIFLYSIQQYADFSGGIDVVLGVSALFGIKMMQNFRQPYFSISLSDFWRRWHISLGAWMRDYVFYPLALTKGMQRFGKGASKRLGKHFGRVLPAAIANMVVFLIVGLWHGGELHFILWGLYNGLIIALSDIFSPFFGWIAQKLRIRTHSKSFHFFQIIRTFIIVNIGWYFDRIENVKNSFIGLKNTFYHFNSHCFMQDLLLVQKGETEKLSFVVLFFSLSFLVFHSVLQEKKIDFYLALQKRNVVLRWSICYFMFFLILVSLMLTAGGKGFLYENF